MLFQSYNKTKQQQQQQNKHTHETQDEDQRSTIGVNTKKQRPTVSANPHLRDEGRRMKRKRKWGNITHAIHLKFKTSVK